MNIYKINRREWFYIGLIALIGLAVFAYKIHLGILDYNGDYVGYVSTAQSMVGIPGAVFSGQRILKPLEPALNALLAPMLGWRGSFLFIVGLFYVLLVIASWLFFKNFFTVQTDASSSSGSSRAFLFTASATALFSLSYPILRYGLDAYTETGALFFYMLGLLGAWYFLKRPSWRVLAFTFIANVLGFLWKEYVVVSILILQIVILWHPLLKGQIKKKVQYLVAFDGLFLVGNLLWQAFIYEHFHYNYFDFYISGGASGFHETWSIFIVIKSLFALLIAGSFFVPFGFAELRRLPRENRFFFWLVCLVPLICLGYGAVSSRLFYVCTPALIILCLFGVERFFRRPHDQATLVILFIALDFGWLFFHL